MQQVEDKQLGFHLSDAHLEKRLTHQRGLVNLAISSFLSVSLMALGLAFLVHHNALTWAYNFGTILIILGAFTCLVVLWRATWRGEW